MHGLRMRPSRASVPAPVAGTQSKHLREAGPRVLQKLGPTPSRSPLQPPGWVRYQNSLEPRLQIRCKELARKRSAWELGTLTRSARRGTEPLPLPGC